MNTTTAQEKNPATKPTDPPGGQPLNGAKQSMPDLEEQVAYHRAFEAVVWAMPASAIHRFRQGLYEVPGVEDNVVIAFSGTLKARHEVITANTALPYIAAFTDLRRGPVVVEVPAATEKASLYSRWSMPGRSPWPDRKQWRRQSGSNPRAPFLIRVEAEHWSKLRRDLLSFWPSSEMVR